MTVVVVAGNSLLLEQSTKTVNSWPQLNENGNGRR